MIALVGNEGWNYADAQLKALATLIGEMIFLGYRVAGLMEKPPDDRIV